MTSPHRAALLAPKEVASLRGRWSAEARSSINRHLSRFFPSKITPRQPLDLSQFDLSLHEGRIDLRGFPLDAVVNRYSIRAVDFSGMSLHGFGQFGPWTDISDCVFDRAEVGTNLRNEIYKCSFVRANLRRAEFGLLCEDCDFSSAVLATSGASQTTFRRCTFRRADLRYVSFSHCAFEDCTFADCKVGPGSLVGSRFQRSGVTAHDFRSMILDGVRFED